MPELLTLTHRDLEILLALAQRVRLLSLRQIAREWFEGEVANARRRLKALRAANLVQPLTVMARTLPVCQAPIVCWDPGAEEPAFGKVAYQLQLRWQRRPARRTTIYLATRRAAHLLGGKAKGELKNVTQATHDLGVAEVWLHYRRTQPAIAEAWRGEDSMAHTRRGQKLPDAFLVNEAGATFRVVEFGGAYDADRVSAFHDDCVAHALPYEIW